MTADARGGGDVRADAFNLNPQAVAANLLARAEAAEAETARLRHDIEALRLDLNADADYRVSKGSIGHRLRAILLAAERDPEPPVVLDLDDRIFDGQTLPDALADYEHVHSTTGVCVKNTRGPFCARAGDPS